MPTIVEAFQQAITLQSEGKLTEAETIYRRVLEHDANQPDAWHLLGWLEHARTNLPQAINCMQRAVQLLPENAAFHNSYGIVLADAQRHSEALACFEKALQLQPQYAQACYNAGLVLEKIGNYPQAAQAFFQATQFQPNYAEAHNNLGLMQSRLSLIKEAHASFSRAIELNPQNPQAWNNLGNSFVHTNDLERAKQCFQQAIQIDPRNAEAYYNLGNLLKQRAEHAAAIASYEKALQCKPDYSQAMNNLGIALGDLGRVEEALRWHQQALQLAPRDSKTYNNLGINLMELGQYAQAEQCFQESLKCDPHDIETHVNRSLLLLLHGDWIRGWQAFNSRFQLPSFLSLRAGYNLPYWQGEALAGKSILLSAEQGLGDNIQFIRFAKNLHDQGAKVFYGCPPQLRQLFTMLPSIDHLLAPGEPVPACDFHLPLMSVPAVMQTTPSSVPNEIPYLSADPELVECWGERLAEHGELFIGINWHGKQSVGRWNQRDIPLELFQPISQLPSVTLVNLQTGHLSEHDRRVKASLPLLDFGDELDRESGPFMDTAAIMHHLDLVISCDSSVPHLAGALGVPVWMALPFAPDWRWLLRHEHTPWYPTMRLFRQQQRGNWPGVMQSIYEALKKVLEKVE